MATVQVSLNQICAGGGHVHFNFAVNGGSPRSLILDTDDILAPIAEDDIKSAALVILKLRMRGKTRQQARSDLEAGFTVTI